MLITSKSVHKVQFPAFKLKSSNWDLSDGLLFVDGILVDDLNMPGATLGQRRLRTPFKDLYPLNRAVQSHLGLIKNMSGPYIDTKGMPFLYEKTKFVSLKYHKIRKIELKEVASVLWLKDINFPFTIPRPPKAEYTWAGVLYAHGLPWMLYGYATEKLKDTRRKI